jgi:ferredoxin-NADP reductase
MTEDWTQAWRAATVLENREAGRGCRLLHLEVPDTLPFPFEPGHVVVLRLGGFRHPYTLSRVDQRTRRVGILFRAIPGGRLTPVLEALAPGAPVELSGLHHEPVAAMIAPGARAVVGLSTGSGIGPLWGFSEQALAAGFDRPITLFPGFREAEDICLAPELDALQAEHPTFAWHPTLTLPPAAWTGLQGRLGQSAPPRIREPRTCHFHLVGNGAMLAEMKAALALAGVPPEQVTSEVFFNFNAQADPEEVKAIAARFA